MLECGKHMFWFGTSNSSKAGLGGPFCFISAPEVDLSTQLRSLGEALPRSKLVQWSGSIARSVSFILYVCQFPHNVGIYYGKHIPTKNPKINKYIPTHSRAGNNKRTLESSHPRKMDWPSLHHNAPSVAESSD